MILGTLAVIFLALLVIGALVAIFFFAILSFAVGILLHSSRFDWLSPFLIWIPTLVGVFVMTFVGYSAYALFHSWPFPADLLEFFVMLALGILFSAGAGLHLALSTRRRKELGVNHQPAVSRESS